MTPVTAVKSVIVPATMNASLRSILPVKYSTNPNRIIPSGPLVISIIPDEYIKLTMISYLDRVPILVGD
jgi:hypothetical protein